MTGRMLEQIERLLLEEPPDAVLVYGDTNSTLAGALAAAKLQIPVAHVEAGLRSFNRRMPEEINRILTDHASALLFAPTAAAVDNLRREGTDPEKIALVGDVMYDAMLFHRRQAEERSRILEELGLRPKRYILATVHRAENTDDPARLRGVMDGLGRLAEAMDVVLPLHPRTLEALRSAGILEGVKGRMRVIEPVGYLDMVLLEASAALVATDSGGVQKEAYFHRVPCLTLREETEWVELLEVKANTLVGADPERIARCGRQALGSRIEDRELYGNGRASEAVVEKLASR
jgi:UDP-GlcNAc3NAcA epimerase